MSEAVKQALVLFAFFGLPGIAGAWIGYTKGKNAFIWFAVCGMFPPTLMILLNQTPKREVEGHYRRCPACGEMQKWKFAECKYCGAGMLPLERAGSGSIR